MDMQQTTELKSMKQKLIKLKEDIGKSTIR